MSTHADTYLVAVGRAFAAEQHLTGKARQSGLSEDEASRQLSKARAELQRLRGSEPKPGA